MGKNIRLPLLPAFAVYAILSAAGAVDVPPGIESNLILGEFADNKYVTLEKATSAAWVDKSAGEATELVEVRLAFREPDDPDPAEKISIAFVALDQNMDKKISKIMGGTVRSSGRVAFAWDMLDAEGKPLADGVYKALMNITGDHHGDLLRAAVFPLYLTIGAPKADNAVISSREATLEYDGAPTLFFRRPAWA
jgi:hypothetical protein